ncbi:hypothetical protein BGX31_002202, partial [Mortierella sp. GBA43]
RFSDIRRNKSKRSLGLGPQVKSPLLMSRCQSIMTITIPPLGDTPMSRRQQHHSPQARPEAMAGDTHQRLWEVLQPWRRWQQQAETCMLQDEEVALQAWKWTH